MKMENLTLFSPLFVLFSISALLFFVFKYSATTNSKPNNLPPGSFGWPIVGETFVFINETQQRIVGDRMRRHSSKLFKTNILGEPTVVFCGISGHKFIASNEEKLFLAWRPHSMQKLFRSSYQKAASQATIPLADAVQIYRAPGFLKPEALVRYIETMDTLVKEHLMLHWDGKSTVEVYHLAQPLVMTLSSRFFTGLQDNRGRTEKFTELMNNITSGLHTVPLSVPGTAFYHAMRKEVLLLIKEKKAAMSSGVQMHDISCPSCCLTQIPPVVSYRKTKLADKIMGLMAGGFHSPI